MATTSSGDGWVCVRDGCGECNPDDVYICRKCRAIRPYLQLSSTESDPLQSDEPELIGATSSVYSITPDTSSWSAYPSTSGGARPKYQASRDRLRETEIDFPGGECRIVLMGKTGNGKSSTGNTILNLTDKDPFPTKISVSSVTKKCQWGNGKRFGVALEVVDTPGFFDTHADEVTITKEITRCIGIVSPGPHALLLVVRLDVRFTEEEARSVEQLRELFGDGIMRHVIIVFTHGDCLSKGTPTSLEDVLKDRPKQLDQVMKQTDHRCVVFNNAEKNQERKDEQVRQLLLSIRGMLSSTGDLPFNNPLLVRCEEVVMRNASQLADLLNSRVKKEHRDMIRAGLESGEKLFELLDEVLDTQEKEQQWQEAARKCKKELQDELSEERKKRQQLEKERDQLRRDKNKLEQEKADREKKSWCVII